MLLLHALFRVQQVGRNSQIHYIHVETARARSDGPTPYPPYSTKCMGAHTKCMGPHTFCIEQPIHAWCAQYCTVLYCAHLAIFMQSSFIRNDTGSQQPRSYRHSACRILLDLWTFSPVRARALLENFSAPRARLPLRAPEFLPDLWSTCTLPIIGRRARMVDEAGARPR